MFTYLLLASSFLARGASAAARLLKAEPEHVVVGEYVVVLKSDLGDVHLDEHLKVMKEQSKKLVSFKTLEANQTNNVFDIQYEYRGMEGFAGWGGLLNEEALAMVMADDNVDYVEESREFHPSQTCVSQSTDVWGLPRIAALTAASAGTTYRYRDLNAAQATIDVYVLDTGITAHSDFGNRAFCGYTAWNDGCLDTNGHGVHVAGTIGGRLYGVAKNVNLIACKVLNPTGSTTVIIAGVNYAVNRASSLNRVSVINMSLGGAGLSSAMNQAIDSGNRICLTVAASGNNARDESCRDSPASASTSLVVNAADRWDAHASFSNWGRCTDVYAPGVDIRSASHRSSTGSVTMSGTSMACPHVAGIAAIEIAMNRALTPTQLRALIINNSRSNVVSRVPLGTPNRYVYRPC